MTLIAIFPKDRTQAGTLEAWSGETLLGTFPVLGKADNDTARVKGNPTRNPEKPYGDTPAGVWRIRVGIIKQDAHAYGPHRIFVMWPLSGQAMRAYEPPNRRNGICLHGGALNAAGGLRPTYGCPRVHNETMARLHELEAQYGRIETIETKEV